MKPAELAQVRAELLAFAAEMFAPLPRSDQRRWGETYLRGLMTDGRRKSIAPLALIVDDTGFPKAGRSSIGVARQCSGTLGKIGSCQIGVSISAASEVASCPIDWRLFLPEAWDEDAERRAKAHLPASEHQRPKWQLAPEMLAELRGWGVIAGGRARAGALVECTHRILQRPVTAEAVLANEVRDTP